LAKKAIIMQKKTIKMMYAVKVMDILKLSFLGRKWNHIRILSSSVDIPTRGYQYGKSFIGIG